MEHEFIELFKGYERDFGMADMSKTELDSEKNKIKPNYEWAGRPVTLDDYKNHLQGKKSIGIQPCRIDKTAQFGCIDIDPPDYGSFKVENYLVSIRYCSLTKDYSIKTSQVNCLQTDAIPNISTISNYESKISHNFREKGKDNHSSINFDFNFKLNRVNLDNALQIRYSIDYLGSKDVTIQI